jgi:diacylglycerol O-acyltransferase
MVYSYPYVPIAGSVRIGIAIFSYCGRLLYGITGDYDTVADINVLRDGIEDGMRELLTAAADAAKRQAASGPAAGKRRRATAGARKGRHTPSG